MFLPIVPSVTIGIVNSTPTGWLYESHICVFEKLCIRKLYLNAWPIPKVKPSHLSQRGQLLRRGDQILLGPSHVLVLGSHRKARS